MAEGDGSPVNVVFTVSLGAPSGQTVTVNYGTADGTAVAGVDYVAAGGALTFPPGTVTQTATVSVLGDLLDEADETFFVNLTNAANATVVDGQGLGTIQDNEPRPSLSIDDVSDGEGDGGLLNLDFTVTLSVASGQVVTVGFATANGTATAGSDYVATAGTLTFPAGTTTQTVSVPVSGDTTVEPNEDFFVNLQNPVNATIADGQGHGIILNDDGITIVINDVTVTEGDSGSTVDAVFSVDLSDIAATDVTVDFATADGTATAGVDYLANSGTLLFPPGTTSLPVTVTVNGDDVAELAETFFVNLSNPTGATIFDDQGLGTIAGEDGAGELVHGFKEVYNLAALPGPSAAVGLFRIDQKPQSSYEIVVDSTSGDIGDAGAPVAVDRLDSDASTVLQSAQPVGVGFSRSLRWENSSANEIGDEFVRVQSAECTTDCGTDDQYRIQAYETTYSIPRFNNAGTQITVIVAENPAEYAINGTVWFWNTSGILLASHPFTLNPKGLLVLNTANVPGRRGDERLGHGVARRPLCRPAGQDGGPGAVHGLQLRLSDGAPCEDELAVRRTLAAGRQLPARMKRARSAKSDSSSSRSRESPAPGCGGEEARRRLRVGEEGLQVHGDGVGAVERLGPGELHERAVVGHGGRAVGEPHHGVPSHQDGGEHVRRRIQGQGREVLPQALRRDAPQETRGGQVQRAVGSHHERVVAVEEHHGVGEGLREGPVEHLHVGRLQVVERHPLGEHAARLQVRAAERVEVDGVEVHHARLGRVHGLHGDGVVAVAALEQEVTAVVEVQPEARVAQDVVVLAAEAAEPPG